MNFAPNDAENVLTFLSRAHGTLKSSFLCTHQRQLVSVSPGTRILGGDRRAAFPHMTVQLVSSVRNFIIKTQNRILLVKRTLCALCLFTISRCPRLEKSESCCGKVRPRGGSGRTWPPVAVRTSSMFTSAFLFGANSDR